MSYTRRTLLVSAAPFFVRKLISAPPSGTLCLGAFGAGKMAFSTLNGIGTHPKVKVVCAAEVDSALLGSLKDKYPEARVYQDWREMLRKERRNLDAVSVGTPDHMHAPQAMSAMNLGLHAYVQKPLAQNIYEARQLTEAARRNKLITQMGIQVHSRVEYRTAVRLIQDGAIGKVREVHSWSGKKWGDAGPPPERTDPVPSTLDWNLWLGVAAPRPYIEGEYHPGKWRRRVDFGTGTFGDMGCHILDPVFGSLALTAPLTVRSEGSAPSAHSWAVDALVRYVFPGTRYTEGKSVGVTWYDGARRPPQDIAAVAGERKLPFEGSIFLGTNGAMLLPHGGAPVLLPEKDFAGYRIPEVESANHYHQFAEAVLGNGPTWTPLDYSGPLTEAVLLGPLATRFPNTTLEWNGAKLKFRNSPEATRFVRRRYRDGWKVKGLS